MQKLFSDKRGILPRNLIIIVVLISLLMVSATYWISEWQDKYSPIEPANIYSSYSSLEGITTSVDTIESKLQAETKATGVGFLDFIVQGGYNVLLSVLSIPNTLRLFVGDIGAQFGIPRVYIDGFIILISVGTIFGIIGSIFRRKT